MYFWTFGESILFTEIINLIILLPAHGFVVVVKVRKCVCLRHCQLTKPMKSNTKVIVWPKCPNKSNVAKRTNVNLTHIHTDAHGTVFNDAHHNSVDQQICTGTKYQCTHTHTLTLRPNNDAYCSNAQKAIFHSVNPQKNRKHTNKADNSDQLSHTHSQEENTPGVIEGKKVNNRNHIDALVNVHLKRERETNVSRKLFIEMNT